MKRWMLVLLMALLGVSYAGGCTVDADDDDDELEIKADTEGDEKSIKIDKD